MRQAEANGKKLAMRQAEANGKKVRIVASSREHHSGVGCRTPRKG
jgi:hypothetical protein